MKNIFRFILLILIGCSSAPLKPIKAENYNRTLQDVMIITSFDMVTEKYENDLLIELKNQFQKDSIRNTYFSYGKSKLNKDQELTDKIKSFKPQFILSIDDTVRRTGSYGSSSKYLIKITDVLEKSEVWQLDVWGAGRGEQFAKDIYLSLMQTQMINSLNVSK